MSSTLTATLVDNFTQGVAPEVKEQVLQGVKGVLEQWQGRPWPTPANIKPLIVNLPGVSICHFAAATAATKN